MLTNIHLGGPGSGHHDHKGRKGFRGGSLPSDESSPINDDERQLSDYLNMADKMTNGRSKESFVLKNGRFYEPQNLPKGIRKGQPKLCYMNAFNLAMNNDEYTYVEGYAVPDFAPIPIKHAWVVDDDGNVIDNTWKTPGVVYFGIPFENRELAKIVSEKGTYGAIERGNPKYESYIKGLSFDTNLLKELGGEGSGHHGHSGRPGKVGGSSPSKALINKIRNRDDTMENPFDPSITVFLTSLGDDVKAHVEISDHTNFMKDKSPAVYFNITVPEKNRGKGFATEVMREMMREADEAGVSLVGTPSAFGQGKRMTTRQLRNWYISLGFEELGDDVIYTPKRTKTLKIGKGKVIIPIMNELGGPGSGNHGHEGRPGKVGGSAPSEGDIFDEYGEIGALEPVFSDEHNHARKYPPGAKSSMNEDISPEFELWEDGLSYEHKRAMADYSGSSYQDINDYLRHNEEYTIRVRDAYTYKGTPDENEVLEHLTSVSDKVKLIDQGLSWSDGFKTDTIIYRGIDFDPDLDIGDEITDEAYMSTSLDLNVSIDFTRLSRTDTNVLFEINWPAGKPIGYLNNFSEVPGEMEMLVPRGVTLRVDGLRSQSVNYEGHIYDFRVLQMSYVEGIPELSVDVDLLIELGGPGSGNHGHSGRPGQVGGSDDDGVPNSKPSKSGPRRTKTNDDINNIKNEFADWESGLLDDERKAIASYTDDAYNEINEALRNNAYTGDKKIDRMTNDQIDRIDEALSMSPGFSQPTTVYRGIDHDPELGVGDTFFDKGFGSTSLLADVAAESFAALGGDEGVLFEIECPARLPCAYVSNIGGNSSEAEVLLPRNVEFEVKNISKHLLTDGTTIKVYHLDLVEWFDSM